MMYGIEPHQSGFTPTTSPISMHGHSTTDPGQEVTEFGVWTSRDRKFGHSPADQLMEMQQRSPWLDRPQSDRPQSEPATRIQEVFEEQMSSLVERSGPRRRPSRNTRDRPQPSKGLNPDAKVFNLSKPPSSCLSQLDSFDALNPNGLGSQITPSTASSLLRAFAPSPAERQALHRALGGSTNRSFERLPSLSDVGSIPSSPTQIKEHSLNERGHISRVLPAWVQSLSLPRHRKSNFSPWDAEDTSSTTEIDLNGDGEGIIRGSAHCRHT